MGNAMKNGHILRASAFIDGQERAIYVKAFPVLNGNPYGFPVAYCPETSSLYQVMGKVKVIQEWDAELAPDEFELRFSRKVYPEEEHHLEELVKHWKGEKK
ncbi:MAG: hypothetical protein NUV67_04990 [archaeon]|nr:hypothetical protein [archaeon]